MARIIIASASEANRTQLSRLLTSSGYQIYRCCASEQELRRTLTDCEDGVVVIVGALPDCKMDELIWDYWERIQILWIAKPLVLADCESPCVFHLPLPISGQAVVGAVNMLTQLHQMRLPKRSGTEKQTVEQAKELLMRREGWTEPEAHRHMQQYAMNHGLKMSDYAARIIGTSMRTEE